MMHRCVSVLVLLLGVMAAGLAGIAQQPATEAPAGFDTPTLAHNPGSQSKSNGIAEPPRDTYALDQRIYQEDEDVSTRLGPFTTQGPARIAIKTLSAEPPANLPNSASGITTPTATL
jgi:hypothetical protein